MKRAFVFSAVLALSCLKLVKADEIFFKSPGPGMHFTQGLPVIIFADLFDSLNDHGYILCEPSGVEADCPSCQLNPAQAGPPRPAGP